MSMTSTLLNKAAVFGKPAQLGKGNATACRASARLGGTKQLKKEVKKEVKKAGSQIKKAAGGAIKGPRTNKKDELWLPNTTRPAWLDGSLPGDRGFDPLGLAKPVEYLQYDVDSLDQNLAVNKAGRLLGKAEKKLGNIVSETTLQPYSEVFGLERFRENELIHGRWAMLACLGVLVAEASTGVAWQDAGKIELDGAQYLGFRLPFTITQLLWIEAILVGGAEFYRNGELDLEKRIYPGGYFDPLGFASEPERAYRLKTAEIKHGRLAMVSFLGFSVQAASTGKGALGSLATAAASFKDAV